MFQIGALAALEHAVGGLQAGRFDAYYGASSGASVAAALAGGVPVQRLYRACLDPVDNYFSLERRNLLRVDGGEWQRVMKTAFRALRHGSSGFFTRGPAPTPAKLWAELDRLYDSLPAGVFSLDPFERFLEDFFVRRGIPNTFARMPRKLRVVAHDLDSGDRVVFGDAAGVSATVSRACAASLATPPFFSPVQVGKRHFIDAGAAQAQMIEDAMDASPDVVLIVNAMVPVNAKEFPTGHGMKPSVRDKGTLWVSNQASRIGTRAMLHDVVERVRLEHPRSEMVVIEPEPTDAILFMHNPASFAARREILEFAYRTTRARAARWVGEKATVERLGWKPRGGSTGESQ